MGRLTTSYSSYCYDSGTLFNRAVSKYFRNCGSRNDSSGSSRSNSRDDGGVLEGERNISCGTNQSIIELMEGKQKLEETLCSENEEDEYEGNVELIDENRLSYRAEGNANIVLSLSDSRQVLRLRKSVVDDQSGNGEQSVCFVSFGIHYCFYSLPDSNLDLQRFIKYSTVTASLFSHRYVPEPKLGRLNSCDLKAFNANLARCRPGKIVYCYGNFARHNPHSYFYQLFG